MNYRHAFHAGNFADLVKHAALLVLLEELTAAGGPLTVIDSHAGRGLYAADVTDVAEVHATEAPHHEHRQDDDVDVGGHGEDAA